MNLYCSILLGLGIACVDLVGGVEAEALASVEPSVKYHSFYTWTLTGRRNPGLEQWYVGSLTGAVSS